MKLIHRNPATEYNEVDETLREHIDMISRGHIKASHWYFQSWRRKVNELMNEWINQSFNLGE